MCYSRRSFAHSNVGHGEGLPQHTPAHRGRRSEKSVTTDSVRFVDYTRAVTLDVAVHSGMSRRDPVPLSLAGQCAAKLLLVGTPHCEEVVSTSRLHYESPAQVSFIVVLLA